MRPMRPIQRGPDDTGVRTASGIVLGIQLVWLLIGIVVWMAPGILPAALFFRAVVVLVVRPRLVDLL